MHIANITPPQWAGTFPQGPYRMALAHWVLDNQLYAKKIRLDDPYILMDNGAFEGSQVEVALLNEATTRIAASEVVLPDTPGNARETLQKSWASLGRIASKRIMFVPQGNSIEEWSDCLTAWLIKWEESSWKETYVLSLGITSLRIPGSTKPQIGSRFELIKKVIKTGYPAHLLGVPNTEEFLTRELPEALRLGVRGFDTSLAFALAAKGILLTSKAKKVQLGDPAQYEMLPTNARRLVYLNQAILRARTDGICADEIPTRLIRDTAQRWLKYWAEGFEPLVGAMRACGMPIGRYALCKEDGREKHVRLLGEGDLPGEEEELYVLEPITTRR